MLTLLTVTQEVRQPLLALQRQLLNEELGLWDAHLSGMVRDYYLPLKEREGGSLKLSGAAPAPPPTIRRIHPPTTLQAFAAGETMTLADVALFPAVATLERLGPRLIERFPEVRRYVMRLRTRASIMADWPLPLAPRAADAVSLLFGTPSGAV